MKDNNEWDTYENAFFYMGIISAVSFIFLMRNISIMAGIPLFLSGNFEMRFSTIEMWRFMLPVFSIILSILLTIITVFKTKSGVLNHKPFAYIKTFVTGILLIAGIEIFFAYFKSNL